MTKLGSTCTLFIPLNKLNQVNDQMDIKNASESLSEKIKNCAEFHSPKKILLHILLPICQQGRVIR